MADWTVDVKDYNVDHGKAEGTLTPTDTLAAVSEIATEFAKTCPSGKNGEYRVTWEIKWSDV